MLMKQGIFKKIIYCIIIYANRIIIYAKPQIIERWFERQWNYFMLYVECSEMENASLIVFYAG